MESLSLSVGGQGMNGITPYSRDNARRDVSSMLAGSTDFADEDDLISLGLDSMKIMRLAGKWRRAGCNVTFAELMSSPRLADWLLLLEHNATASPVAAQTRSEVAAATANERPFPLTDVQYAYWIGRRDSQVLGGMGCHAYLEFDGANVEPQSLARAWQMVLRSHPMLHARFLEDGTQQIPAVFTPPQLEVTDLRTETPQRLAAGLEAIRARLSHRRLRVEQGEVIGLALSMLPEGRTRIHLDVDLLVADLQSLHNIVRDLTLALTGKTLPAPQDWSFAAYLDWERQTHEAKRRTDESWWQERLNDLPLAPGLPLRENWRDLRQPIFTRRSRRISWLEWQRFEGHCRKRGLTPAMTLLTIYADVLARWSGTSRFTVNLPLFNRPDGVPGLNEVVADFTTILILAVDYQERPFWERVKDIQTCFHRDAAHVYWSGVQVLRAQKRLHAGSDDRPQVVFAYNLGSRLADAASDAVLGRLSYMISQTPQVGLDFQVHDLEDAVLLAWDSVDDIFPERLIDDMFAACMARMQQALDDDESKLNQAIVLPQQPTTSVLPIFALSDHRLLHDAFFAHAQRNGDAQALIDGASGVCTSYGMLARQARQVAALLQREGIRPGDTVAITLPRGTEQVAAVLGTVAAGACYVPMSPSQPVPRMAHMYIQGRVRCTLTNETLANTLVWPQTAKPVDVNAAWDLPDDVSLPFLPSDALAYIIFTSGSTGMPKGVVIEHAAACNTIAAVNHLVGVGTNDRLLTVSALDFDLSVYDIFGVLGSGGQLVQVGDASWRDAAAWLDMIQRHNVTMWNSVPTLLDMLLTTVAGKAGRQNPSTPLPLKTVLLSGDRVGLDLPSRLWTCAPSCRFFALGGATEAAIWSNVFQVTSPPPTHWHSIPYGQPLSGQCYRVVDGQGRDCPTWTAGELWIGGTGLARGYANDPEQTARRFVVQDGSRWYRTGDQGRFWADGTIEFLGRLDFQLKIRGHRIEPGEIEGALRRHPAVRQAAVQGVDTGTTRRLVAWVVFNKDIARSELRAFLGQNLPSFMIPEQYVAMTALPLNANGKVDRKALPLPDEITSSETVDDPPCTPLEQKLAVIWQQELGLTRVGRQDNFLQCGGDSLMATRLVTRIRRELGCDLPLDQLFLEGTIAAVAARLERHDASPVLPELPQIVPSPKDRLKRFPFTDIQYAYWIGRSNAYELGQVSSHIFFEIDSQITDIPRLNAAWRRVVARHDMLRAVCTEDGQQVLADTPDYSLSVQDLRGIAPEKREQLLAGLRREMSRQMLPADRWPLFDLRAVRYDAEDGERTRLFLDFDALIADAWSVFLVLGEWMDFYEQPALRLPELTLFFRDCVLAGTELEKSAGYQEDRDWWLARLDSLPPAPALPLACRPEELRHPEFLHLGDRLPAPLWTSLQENAAKAGITASGLLISAYAEVLGRWSQNSHFTLNLTLFNRQALHPQMDVIVGDFTSLSLLEVDLRSAPSFVDRARALQRQLWTDMNHRQYSGIRVLREMTQRAGRRASMPVVFTGALGLGRGGHEQRKSASLERLGQLVFGCAQTPQVWLDYQAYEQEGGLVVNWDAVDGLFPAGLPEAMFAASIDLMHALARQETWDLEDPVRLPAAQLSAREDFNASDCPQDDCTLPDLVLRQVASHSDSIAVISATGTISYGQLAGYARAVALAAVRCGLHHGAVAAVVMEKGWEQAAACLGILMAGAAYLPLDPELPEERLHWILEDSQAKIILSQQSVIARLPWPAGIQPIAVDGLEPAEHGPETAPANPKDLAYIIYTSGSTGRPKGVMINHRGAVNTILDINRRFNVNCEDRVLATSALHFDLSVYDLFGVLGSGGAVVMPPSDGLRDPECWIGLIQQHGISLWNSAPALMEMLVLHLENAHLKLPNTLRLSLLSGDWIPVALPARLAKLAPNMHIVSLGGATEASIWSVAHYPVAAERPDWASVPYGRPLANQRLYVLNDAMSPCPDWTPGHLYIGGTGLAMGYWHAPENTKAAFIRHPKTGEALYKTGDLARFRPEGLLEFLGRDDFQVKIRGQRIELGEIEYWLLREPGVQAATVVVAGSGDDAYLVAFVAPRPAHGSTPSEGWLDNLRRKLPASMVPRAVTALETMPLTTNGKVDRKALIELAKNSSAPPAAKRALISPQSEAEQQVASLWMEVLHCPQVGREENFFEQGGNSLLAVQLAHRLRDTFHQDFPIITVFANPTVAAQACLVNGKQQDGQDGATLRGERRFQALRQRFAQTVGKQTNDTKRII